MKIASFNVTRFRSIEEAECRLHDMTILLGPNNEGKSNILRAMVIGMEELSRTAGRLGRYRRRPQLRGRRDAFDWERDFPLHLRETGEQTTVLEFAFSLSDQEVAAFTAEVGSRINGDLRVSLTFDQNRGLISLITQADQQLLQFASSWANSCEIRSAPLMSPASAVSLYCAASSSPRLRRVSGRSATAHSIRSWSARISLIRLCMGPAPSGNGISILPDWRVDCPISVLDTDYPYG